jgi:hypothetical protein
LIISYIEKNLYIDEPFDDSLISLICEICKVNRKCIAYKPCGHILSCWSCAIKIKNCPNCNKEIKNFLKIYFP